MLFFHRMNEQYQTKSVMHLQSLSNNYKYFHDGSTEWNILTYKSHPSQLYKSCDSSVYIVLGYGLDDQGSRV